jgi:hypothetical protein
MNADDVDKVIEWQLGWALAHKDFRAASESLKEIPPYLKGDFDFLVKKGCAEAALRSSLALASKLPDLVPNPSANALLKLAANLESVIAEMMTILPSNAGGLSPVLRKRLAEKVALYRELAAFDRPRKDRLRLVTRAIPSAYVQQMTKRPHLARVSNLLEAVGIKAGDNYGRDVGVAREHSGALLDSIVTILYLRSRANSTLEILAPDWPKRS